MSSISDDLIIDEWVEIDITNINENEEDIKIEPGSVIHSIQQQKQQEIEDILVQHIQHIQHIQQPGSSHKLSSSQLSQESWSELSNHSSSINNKLNFKSPSPVIVKPINNKSNEGSPKHLKHIRSWNSINNPLFDVQSIGSSVNTQHDNNNNNNNNNSNSNNNSSLSNNNSSSYSGSNNRIPFSWAEITKIGTMPNKKGEIKKMKLLTIQNSFNSNQNMIQIPKKSRRNFKQIKTLGVINENNLNGLPPECDPSSTKSDLGRRVKHKRIGKRGNRIKYVNGKRASRRNPRRKK